MSGSTFSQDLVGQMPRLRRYARVLCRGCNSEVDDLMQGTLCRALEKQQLFREGTDLRAWLFTIMHHLHVHQIRYSKRHETCELQGFDRPMAQTQELEVLAHELVQAIEALPERWRRALLSKLAGEPLTALGPKATVHKWVRKARQALEDFQP